MDCQIPTSSEQSRMYWTPTMERYFVDLMLDHMQQGNRVGHTFNKQAWTEMLIMFCAKFGSQLDDDILKNHYTALWKQFNDVKDLLDQNGFSWDDTQQMVVADDDVWDAYIKGHPEVQHYRNKPIMNFNDLCFIFAYTTADGRYSRSSHDIDFEDEIQGLNGEAKEAQTPSFSNCIKTYWSLAMDHYLIDLLLDQVLEGNKIGDTFIISAWNEMLKSFNSRFGSHYEKGVLMNRYKHLRQQYNDVKHLLSYTGFSWDKSWEMVTAEEYVWDSFTKMYPDAELYRFVSVPSYQKLCVIYGEEGCNGRPSCTSHPEDLNYKHPDSYYSKTYWTPSMDRYLVDLLLKQVHKRQRIDGIFSEQIWIDIAASFNDRFGSQPDKYILEGQYKCLKKLYNDVKNLLELDEFSWDESRQMVVGPDDFWDAYTQEHPEGTLFRTKRIPNYNDLCIVCGNLAAEGRSNQSDPYVYFSGDALQNGNCLRSGWAPPMDQYFIDLMLEQIRRGNMVDRNFNRQGWDAIIAKFVAKFGSQYDQDVLKWRFKVMRKLFLDMRVLIDENGFVWDELRQMVTASDETWDAYVKEYSDVQSYWNRPLPSYNDLMLIYGNASADGRHSHVTNLDDDALQGNISREDSQSSSTSDMLGICWSKQMDSYFIKIMFRQVLGGNKVGHTFNKQAWACMTASINKKFGLQFDKHVLENQFLSLMKQYDDISTLLNQNGFVHEEIQKRAIFDDDDMWEDYIKEHPGAISYKDTILENYNKLSTIFTGEIHDGKSRNLFQLLNADDNALDMGVDGIFGAPPPSPARDIEVSSGRKRHQPTLPLTSTRGRKIKKTCKDSQEVGTSYTVEKNFSSIESIVDALQTVPDMDDELFFDACDLLEDERKARAFVKMDIPRRKKWLLRNLRS
ncbi:hypothetical protein NMG60_11020718 [Bertholletia excelsa]